MPRHLALIRHSTAQIEPETPAAEWHLSPEGLRRCQPLSAALGRFRFETVFHSLEPKARETAQEIARHLQLECQPWRDLHEHERSGSAYTTLGAFERSIRRFFTHPDRVVFGSESADAAFARFSAAIDRLVSSESPSTEKDLCAVSHGTVISLFAARHNNTQAFAIWKRLALPSVVVLTLPHFELTEILD